MKIGLLTSGGDAPGMNAAVRSVARCAFARGWEVMGVEDGYQGLIDGSIHPFDDRSVAGILQRGGTVLGSTRSQRFMTKEGQQEAAARLKHSGIEGVAVVGGEGSLAGALELKVRGLRVVGIPATIDNDVWGTDAAVGVDTALNAALECIDRIKDTASSLRRSHIVEVMGRRCGYLALMGAIAGGAEAVLVPEFEPDSQGIVRALKRAYKQGKRHFIIFVAEGASLSAQELHEYLNRLPDDSVSSRLTVLGYVQRGGSPTAFDRTLASRFGAEAVATLADGKSGVMVGLQGQKIGRVPITDVVGQKRPLDPDIYELAGVLSGLPQDAY